MHIGIYLNKLISVMSFSTEVWMSLLLGAAVTIIIAYIIYRIQKKESTIHKQDHDAKLEEIKLLHQQDSEKIKVLYELIIQSQRGGIGVVESTVLEHKIEQAADNITDQDSDHAQALKAIAEKDKEEADNILDKIAQQEHDLVEMYNLRAINEYRNGSYSEAVKWCRKILELEPESFQALLDLMQCLNQTDQKQETRGIASKKLNDLQREGSTDKVKQYRLLSKIVDTYSFKTEHEQVEPYLFQILQLAEEVFGKLSDEMSSVYNRLGQLYQNKQQYKESEEYFLKALAVDEAESKGDTSYSAMTLNNLAVLYNLVGRYQEALPLLQKVHDYYISTLGEDHPNLIYSLMGLGTIYVYTGRYQEAEACMLRGKELAAKKLGVEHTVYINVMRNLAATYNYMQKYSESEAIIRELMDKSVNKNGSDSYKHAELLSQLSSALINQNKDEEAEQDINRALEIFHKSASPDDPVVIGAETILAKLNMKNGNNREAEHSFLEIYEIYHKLGQESTVQMAGIEISLAKIYIMQEKWTDAEKYLSKAISYYELKAPNNPEYLKAIQQYSEIMEKLGSQDEAETWKTKAEELKEKLEG